MKKFVILLSLVLVLTFLVSPTNATIGIELDDDLSECTIGVHNSYISTHDSPVLWKVGDNPTLESLPEDACGIIKYYSSEEWGNEYNVIAGTITWENINPDLYKKIAGGLNEVGVGTGNSIVTVKNYSNTNLPFMFHVLGNYGGMDEIRDYIETQTEFTPSGCFPFIDSAGNASMFELDPSVDDYWEYDTMDPDRESQGLLGFVVRANEFHKQDDGKDDTSIIGRYLIGTENTLGLIESDEFNEKSVVQSDSSEVYRLIRQNEFPWPISNKYSRGASVIRGVAPDEHPALATMWVLLGNPSFSIAVPTWAAVSDIPDSIGTCDMYNIVTSLFDEESSNKGRQNKAEWVQAAVLPAESHLFEMVNEQILPHWRAAGGPPVVEEMTRIEHQMAEDAYSVVNYLADTGDQNLAPTIDFEAQHLSNLAYKFIPDASDVDGSIVSYLWNFGDGTTSEKDVPEHDFLSAGVYLVSVTVTDDDGVSTTAWRYLTITEE